MKASAISLTLIALTSACGGKPELDVGEETNQTGEALSDYAADWDGYIESFKVSGDGSDRIRISLDENGEGWVRYGDQALLEPAIDPNGLYPDVEWIHNNFEARVQSGFEYPIMNARVSSRRIVFDYDLSVVDESWCVLQPPEQDRGYSCAAGGAASYDPDTGRPIHCEVDTPEGRVVVDCEAYSACRRCECDETSCHAKPNSLSFDGALSESGDTLVGMGGTAHLVRP